MLKTVGAVVPQCAFLILTSSEGFNMQVLDLQILHQQLFDMEDVWCAM
jgi:hypothetical protein